MTKKLRFRESYDSSLICPHRDLSVCDECAGAIADTAVEVYGRWFADPTGEIRASLAADRDEPEKES